MMHPSVHVHPCVANGEANDEPTELLEAPKDLLEDSVLVFDDLFFIVLSLFIAAYLLRKYVAICYLSLARLRFLFACTLSPARAEKIADAFIEALW